MISQRKAGAAGGRGDCGNAELALPDMDCKAAAPSVAGLDGCTVLKFAGTLLVVAIVALHCGWVDVEPLSGTNFEGLADTVEYFDGGLAGSLLRPAPLKIEAEDEQLNPMDFAESCPPSQRFVDDAKTCTDTVAPEKTSEKTPETTPDVPLPPPSHPPSRGPHSEYGMPK